MSAGAAPTRRLRLIGRLLVLAILLGGLVTAWLYRGALNPVTLGNEIGQYRSAPLIFLLVHIAASLLFVPRTVLAVAAGILFGVWWGIFWSSLGGVLGAVLGFLVARYLNGGLIEPERLARIGPILTRAEEGGWRSVAALRLLPILPHSLGNYALGLTRLSLVSYAWGSLLGQMPSTVAYADLGAAGEQVLNAKAGWLVPTLVGVGVLLATFLLPRLLRRRSA